MQSLRSILLYHFLKWQLAKSRNLKLTIEAVRADRQRSSGKLGKMPKNLESSKVTIEGLQAEWLIPNNSQKSAILLYLHGGAYVTGSILTHRRLAAHLAVAAGASALIVDYRLAPEDPFPAALDDAMNCYLGLRANHPEAKIAVAGDSAGGGLALALCLRLRDQGEQQPDAMALLSPWTDLTLSNDTHKTLAKVDPFFPDRSGLEGAAGLYAGSHDLKDPYISPQFADLTQLPPTLIHVGSRETLLDDSLKLADRMRSYGTPVKIKMYKDMWHVWQVFVGIFPEAGHSVNEIGEFLGEQLTH
jgi:acetyl esterase/lipase